LCARRVGGIASLNSCLQNTAAVPPFAIINTIGEALSDALRPASLLRLLCAVADMEWQKAPRTVGWVCPVTSLSVLKQHFFMMPAIMHRSGRAANA
jgi:hypothetical protein